MAKGSALGELTVPSLTVGEQRLLSEFCGKLKFQSVDKDNMEFEVVVPVTTTCYVRDVLLKIAGE